MQISPITRASTRASVALRDGERRVENNHSELAHNGTRRRRRICTGRPTARACGGLAALPNGATIAALCTRASGLVRSAVQTIKANWVFSAHLYHHERRFGLVAEARRRRPMPSGHQPRKQSLWAVVGARHPPSPGLDPSNRDCKPRTAIVIHSVLKIRLRNRVCGLRNGSLSAPAMEDNVCRCQFKARNGRGRPGDRATRCNKCWRLLLNACKSRA